MVMSKQFVQTACLEHCLEYSLNTWDSDVGSSCILLFFFKPFPEEVTNERQLARSSGSIMLEVVEAYFFSSFKRGGVYLKSTHGQGEAGRLLVFSLLSPDVRCEAESCGCHVLCVTSAAQC